MQKGLCIAALAISVIVFILFLADLLLGVAGQEMLAPFKFASWLIDIVFTICAAILGTLSWYTYRDQV